MSENDPLRAVLQEWKVPEPSTTLDEGVRAGFLAAQPRSVWAQFWSARVSVPLPALVCAAAMALVAAARKSTLSLRGLLAKYGPAPSAEEIDQNRAEMFANFPRADQRICRK